MNKMLYFGKNLFLLILVIGLLCNCEDKSKLVKTNSKQITFPDNLTNYHSSGKILVITEEDKYSGDFQINLNYKLDFQLEIFTPIIGSVLYKIQANPEQFLFLDFRDELYYYMPNNDEIFKEWLNVDLRLEELQWILWGRIPLKEFNDCEGKWLSKVLAVMTFGDTAYELTFNQNGILKKLVKKIDDENEYEILIKNYIIVNGKQFPKIIQVIFSQGLEKLVFGITEIIEDPEPPFHLDFQIPPPEGMQPFIE